MGADVPFLAQDEGDRLGTALSSELAEDSLDVCRRRLRTDHGPAVNMRAEKKLPLSAIKSMQDFGQQCQHDDRSDSDQRDASCFG